jgi:ADP-ribosyl-[dinitrogen reductase] hydrolase
MPEMISRGARGREDRMVGVLLGMAVGDALGLPMEGMSPRRAARVFRGELRHQLVLGRGMISDDTEHACMVAQALLVAPEDPARFARSLAWRLRWWLLGLPAAVGFGTLRAILKLWMGFPPRLSGVRSAGNGPAMRAPVIGAFFAEDEDGLRAAVRASTRLTHRDARAEAGALAIALATAAAVRSADHGDDGNFTLDATALLGELKRHSPGDEELIRALALVEEHLQLGSTPRQLAEALGIRGGISGYIHHTVPVALYCWLRTPDDFRAAITEVIALGGDTDTTAAIVGGMAGGSVGAARLPVDWVSGLRDWPRSVSWMRRLGARLAARHEAPAAVTSTTALGPLRLFWPALLLRNLVFTAIVLMHGVRRMLPPY